MGGIFESAGKGGDPTISAVPSLFMAKDVPNNSLGLGDGIKSSNAHCELVSERENQAKRRVDGNVYAPSEATTIFPLNTKDVAKEFRSLIFPTFCGNAKTAFRL